MIKRLRSSLTVLGLLAFTSLQAQTTTFLEYFKEYECTSATTANLTTHLVIRIDNKRGVSDGNFACYCSPENELKKFSGSITDANGKVLKKLKKSDLTRTEYSSEFISDDYRYLYSVDEPLSYPITVTYDWEESYTDHLNNYPDFLPILWYEIAVDTASLRFIQRKENTMHYSIKNFEPQIKVTEDDGKGRRITEFSVGKMKHMEKLAYGPSFYDLAPRVTISPLKFTWNKTQCDLSNWKSTGQWIWELTQGRDVLTPEVKAKLHTATDTCTTDRSKVAAARKLLGDMTRYISIQLGIGGYQTATAEDVCKRGIGDCKALSNCFCAMLHELGLPAVYTIINTNRRNIIRDIPNPGQFNHVIVQVPLPGDTLWVECTNPLYPVEYRHSDMVGHEVLLVHPEGGELVTIPDYPDSLNYHKHTVDIQLVPDGSVKMDYKESNLNSFFEPMLGMKRMSAKDQREAMMNRLDSKNITIDSLSFQFESTRFDCQMKATATAFAKWSNNRIFLPSTVDSFGALRNTKEEAHPIDLTGDGELYIEELIYHLPEGFEVETKLDPLKIDSPFGSLTRTLEVKDNCLIVTETYRVKSGLYPSDQYTDWVTFRKALADSSKKKLVLKKKE